jgi:prepilin-type N-terminal cleavage/methylation domain-containing protein
MMKLLRKQRRQRGFSFIEIMVALAVLGVITAAIFRLYVTQQRHHLIQDDITNIQQNARSSIDEISRHVRMAGFKLPLGIPAVTASNTNPDTIEINYRTDNCETFLSAPMPQPSAELKCGTDVSCFYEGQWVFIFEPDSGGGEWFEITEVQEAALHLQHNTVILSKKYSANSIVLSMNSYKIFIDNTADPEHPCLMVQEPGADPQVFAEDIVDLQFQYRMKNGMLFDEPPMFEDVREVLIYVQGRSHNPDYTTEQEGDYRFREYATSVFLRNVGI